MAEEAGTVSESRPPVKVIEAYRDYQPPAPVQELVQGMIDVLPAKYLRGLQSIVLTNHSALSYDRRRKSTKSRNRKVKMDRVAGMYHAAWKGQPAWIEIFVDRILPQSRWMRIRTFPEFMIGRVFYHELGHHVHATIRPEFNEKEDVADDWRDRFLRGYLHKKHWFLSPILRAVGSVVRLARHGKKNQRP
ncbi:MAG TPA: hypothetical protein VE825_13940 [Terriglobales bacterium]|jgi:hypothetical protein|nr:hypothetical protein [Terriglobales bacterium]